MKVKGNCVSYILNHCDGIGCENCAYYETYEDWDACDSLVMAMQNFE